MTWLRYNSLSLIDLITRQNLPPAHPPHAHPIALTKPLHNLPPVHTQHLHTMPKMNHVSTNETNQFQAWKQKQGPNPPNQKPGKLGEESDWSNPNNWHDRQNPGANAHIQATAGLPPNQGGAAPPNQAPAMNGNPRSDYNHVQYGQSAQGHGAHAYSQHYAGQKPGYEVAYGGPGATQGNEGQWKK